MTQQHAMELMALISAFYPREQLPDETSAQWLKNLTRIDIADGTKAAEEVTRTCRKWPAWSDFYGATIRALGERLETSKGVLSLGPRPTGPMAAYTKRMNEHVKRIGAKEMNQGESIDALHQEFGCVDHGIKGRHCRPCYNSSVDAKYRIER